MSTRFDIRIKPKNGVFGVSSGYDGLKGSTFTIPSCGITDVDRALFHLLDKEVPLLVTTSDGPIKVPVIIATAEKWATIKKGKALQDGNGSLILPLLTVVKNDIAQSFDKDIAGRGSNQHTGELVIKRRLNKNDREYQSLINKLLITNQDNLAVNEAQQTDDSIVTGRTIGSLTNDPTIIDGGYLTSNLKNNIFEILTIPTPQYVTLKYQVTIWTQYQQQMNEIIESIVSSYMPQTRGWKITTPQGYWFVANVSSDEFKSEDNTDDMTKQERIVRRTFTIDIPAFILVSDTPGNPVAVKRHISNPVVTFGVSVSDDSTENIFDPVVNEPFLGSDDPTLPLSRIKTKRNDLRETNSQRFFSSKDISESDPALSTAKRGRKKSKWKRIIFKDNLGNLVEKLVRIKSYNSHTGEMVLNGNDFNLAGLTIVSIDD